MSIFNFIGSDVCSLPGAVMKSTLFLKSTQHVSRGKQKKKKQEKERKKNGKKMVAVIRIPFDCTAVETNI